MLALSIIFFGGFLLIERLVFSVTEPEVPSLPASKPIKILDEREIEKIEVYYSIEDANFVLYQEGTRTLQIDEQSFEYYTVCRRDVESNPDLIYIGVL